LQRSKSSIYAWDAKGLNLATAARHYKVNGERILRELKERLTKKSDKPNAQAKSQTTKKT